MKVDDDMIATIRELAEFVIHHRHDGLKAKTVREASDAAFLNVEAKHNAERVIAWLRAEQR
jgi:hypothetical protein